MKVVCYGHSIGSQLRSCLRLGYNVARHKNKLAVNLKCSPAFVERPKSAFKKYTLIPPVGIKAWNCKVKKLNLLFFSLLSLAWT